MPELEAARVDRVIQLALSAAAGEDEFRDRELGPIHLVKYVYLADLAHAAAHGGDTFTGARWRFHHFGPWAAEVFERIKPAAASVQATEQRFAGRYDADVVRYSVDDAGLFDRLERDLPFEVVSAVKRGVREHGSNTESLLQSVYMTAPMLRAAPGEVLDFSSASIEREAPPMYQAELRRETAAWKQRRADRERGRVHTELRERVQRLLAERRSRKHTAVSPPPRHDEVFAEGVRWLDGLAGPPPPEGEAEAVFSDDIWKSPTRAGRDLP